VLSSLLLALSIQIGPFYEQRDYFVALRPFWSQEGSTTDVLWPVYTHHRDWWRFCWFMHSQRQEERGGQFAVFPFWISGTGRDGEDYAGLFPVYGRHPHFLMMYDWQYCLWPVWMRYRMPRPSSGQWMTTDAVLFPFFHWRSDGSWGAWPLCGYARQRESFHRYLFWPFITWAEYEADRDTAGKGYSCMVWPIAGLVDREREKQWLFLPPFFSWAETAQPLKGSEKRVNSRIRSPWPFYEVETGSKRDRVSVFPLYENIVDYSYSGNGVEGEITRFGWRLVEIYPDETRVFPFWKKGRDHFRLWPFYETYRKDEVSRSRALAIMPITWADAVDRNWAKFWTFYEKKENPVCAEHSLFWGLINWRTFDD
jgi:hypothetical protein